MTIQDLIASTIGGNGHREVGSIRDLWLPALNPQDLPFTVVPGDWIAITEAQFEYRGPAAALQIMVAWKYKTPLEYSTGAVIDIPIPGYAHSPLINVAEHLDWAPISAVFPFDTADELCLRAPEFEGKTRDGSLYSRGAYAEMDTWVMIWDTVVSPSGWIPNPEDLLAIDTDASVIRLIRAVPAMEARNLEVRYTTPFL